MFLTPVILVYDIYLLLKISESISCLEFFCETKFSAHALTHSCWFPHIMCFLKLADFHLKALSSQLDVAIFPSSPNVLCYILSPFSSSTFDIHIWEPHSPSSHQKVTFWNFNHDKGWISKEVLAAKDTHFSSH